MTTKLGKLMTILWASIQIVTQSLIARLARLLGKLKSYVTTITILFAPKLDRVVKHNEFPLIKLHDPWIT